MINLFVPFRVFARGSRSTLCCNTDFVLRYTASVNFDKRMAKADINGSLAHAAMLEKAGVAAVMANGMPQIKALADLVTTADCDHDGVAELFGRLGI